MHRQAGTVQYPPRLADDGVQVDDGHAGVALEQRHQDLSLLLRDVGAGNHRVRQVGGVRREYELKIRVESIPVDAAQVAELRLQRHAAHVESQAVAEVNSQPGRGLRFRRQFRRPGVRFVPPLAAHYPVPLREAGRPGNVGGAFDKAPAFGEGQGPFLCRNAVYVGEPGPYERQRFGQVRHTFAQQTAHPRPFLGGDIDEEVIGRVFRHGLAPGVQEVGAHQAQQQHGHKAQTEAGDLRHAFASAAPDIGQAVAPGHPAGATHGG